MVRMATQIMLGKKLSDFDLERKKIDHFGVKEAVFPFNMFHEVDPVLGPEMRSTGEVLGIADSFGLAFFKSQEATGMTLPTEGTVLITIADRDKHGIVQAARRFRELGFEILATTGTKQFLEENGIESLHVQKIMEGRPHIVDAIKNGEIQLVINTPIGKRGITDDSYIRKAAIRHKIPYITTMAAAKAAARGIAAFRQKTPEAVSLQKYHSGIR